MEASTSELLNREPFNPTVVLETEPFVQNIPQNLSKFMRSVEMGKGSFKGENPLNALERDLKRQSEMINTGL